MKRLLIIALVTTLGVFAAAPLASAQEPCEIAHECTHHYARFLPPGHDYSTPGLWGWSPSGVYGWQPVLTLATYCYQQGGYYYETTDGNYAWNSCAGA